MAKGKQKSLMEGKEFKSFSDYLNEMVMEYQALLEATRYKWDGKNLYILRANESDFAKKTPEQVWNDIDPKYKKMEPKSKEEVLKILDSAQIEIAPAELDGMKNKWIVTGQKFGSVSQKSAQQSRKVT